MEINQLEKLRDFVCAEITTDSKLNQKQELIDALIQIPIRDGLLRYLYDNPSSRQIAGRKLSELLEDGVKHEKAALATIQAGCFWLDEDIENTKTSLSAALDADPTYSLARLLDVALTHGIPPKVWADSLAAVSPEQCLSGAQ